MKNRILYLHYLILMGAIALGTFLRFSHLGLKPLWMDEVITAIFSLGKSYNDVPLNVVFPLTNLDDFFTYRYGSNCSAIAATVAQQSTHPPLFFCWMYSWLGWLSPLGENWVVKLRSLAALFGVGAIVAIYFVNRIAFSPSSGLMAAYVMAVSPFAVYLSQEARHYTLPMLLITLSLLGLIQIQQDIFSLKVVRVWVWVAWTIINSIGLYVHYFFAIALVAEFLTLFVLITSHHSIIPNIRQIVKALVISISAIAISFLPLLPQILNHYHRSETDWFSSPDGIVPFFQTFINWVLMVVAFPVENQWLPIVIISGFLMIVFGIWVGYLVFKGLRILLSEPTTHLATFTLLSFSACVLFELFSIIYLFRKDITVAPRYNFIYYPSFSALIAASLTQIKHSKLTAINPKSFFLLVGILSCICIISNSVFLKPFQPEKVAERMNFEPTVPLMAVMGYSSYQDVALGLSFALALKQVRPDSADFVFLDQHPDFSDVWKKLSQLPPPTSSKLNLWVFGPGITLPDYPQQIVLSRSINCNIDPKYHYRIGIPYQLYRCGNIAN
jgi:uncharacterized membrane protein